MNMLGFWRKTLYAEHYARKIYGQKVFCGLLYVLNVLYAMYSSVHFLRPSLNVPYFANTLEYCICDPEIRHFSPVPVSLFAKSFFNIRVQHIIIFPLP